MENIDFIKIIKEEISSFDFLGNDEYLKEQEVTDLLQNEDLQKQFICDSLLDKTNKVKIKRILDSQITGNWDEINREDANRISLSYSINIEYKFDAQQEPIVFNLYFNAEKIDISVNGWSDRGRFGGTSDTDIEPSSDSWYDVFDWNDIDVSLYTVNGDDVEFITFEKAPPRIQVLFMRQYLENFIETETMELRTSDMKDNIQNIPYC